jgi:CubicO group peptidase (beta-lactamase class C family)
MSTTDAPPPTHTVEGEPVLAFLRRHLAGDFLLWSPNVQSEAFLNWDRIWATRTIRGGTPIPFRKGDTVPGDFTFESRGSTWNLDELMETEFLSGLLVVKNGEIRLERYARGLSEKRQWQSSSMVKSLASILIGAAVHDGLIASVEEPIVTWIPELEGTEYQEVRIVDLLRMASGIDWVENTDDLQTDVAEHYIKQIAARRPGYVLNYLRTRGRAEPVGTQFYYNTGDTILLSYILSRATGMTVADYCSERFWKPMGCESDGYFILEADGGHEVVGSCCGATLRDYARWGTFMLADGVAANGTRVVPEGWVAESTRPSAPNFAFDMAGGRGVAGEGSSDFAGYGYLWWILNEGDYMALGSYGQWIYVNPAEDTVTVLLGAVPRQIYMSPEQIEVHKDSNHLGSELRKDFSRSVSRAL